MLSIFVPLSSGYALQDLGEALINELLYIHLLTQKVCDCWKEWGNKGHVVGGQCDEVLVCGGIGGTVTGIPFQAIDCRQQSRALFGIRDFLFYFLLQFRKDIVASDHVV